MCWHALSRAPARALACGALGRSRSFTVAHGRSRSLTVAVCVCVCVCCACADPTTKNIQTQKNGFGTFVQKFQTVTGKSKYGVPIFLPNGNVNPAYLAAERAESRAQSARNTKSAEAKRKKLIAKKQFELADYVRKQIGNVGSGKEYYQSGR